MLRDPHNPGTETRFAADQKAGPSLGLTLVRRHIGSGEELEVAFAAASAKGLSSYPTWLVNLPWKN